MDKRNALIVSQFCAKDQLRATMRTRVNEVGGKGREQHSSADRAAGHAAGHVAKHAAEAKGLRGGACRDGQRQSRPYDAEENHATEDAAQLIVLLFLDVPFCICIFIKK